MNRSHSIPTTAALAALVLTACLTRQAATSPGMEAKPATAIPATNLPGPSLRNTFRNDFLIGTALNTEQTLGRDPRLVDLIPGQFNAVTPENSMKAVNIHPAWDQYNFEPADRLIEYSRKHQLQVTGHTLIWHSQLPRFARRLKDVDSVRRFFTDHITTVVSRYKGKVSSWDVVNEALNEDGSLRKSIFFQYLGEDYIAEAFRLAQKSDPDAELYYNDYNIEQPKKREGAIALIKKLQAAGIRIDGVGIQGHWRVNNLPLGEIEESILAYSALGIKVMITELDLSVLPNPWEANTADISNTTTGKKGMNPYTQGLPDSVQTQLSQSYEQLFRLLLRHRDKISRITFWGVDDGQSWLNNFPIWGRTNYPLLFDRQIKPKPAFYAVIGIKKEG